MNQYPFRHFLLCLCTVLTVCVSMVAEAGLTIRGTRFFFLEDRDETVVSFRSLNPYPVLVQAWIDDGDEQADPGTVNVPFILNPAVTRVEPQEGQTIRILGTGGQFAPDRETLYWFNLLEVPPMPDGATGENYLQISGRARMKFFYRPRGLTLHPEQAHEQLHFSPAPPTDDGRVQLRVRNGSPYHITFSHLAVRVAGQSGAPHVAAFDDASRQERMVAPFAELLMPLQGPGSALAAPVNIEVVYGIINDLGGVTDATGTLHAQP